MEALAWEAGFSTPTKTLGDPRNARVKWNARTAVDGRGRRVKNKQKTLEGWVLLWVFCVWPGAYLSLVRRLRHY